MRGRNQIGTEIKLEIEVETDGWKDGRIDEQGWIESESWGEKSKEMEELEIKWDNANTPTEKQN